MREVLPRVFVRPECIQAVTQDMDEIVVTLRDGSTIVRTYGDKAAASRHVNKLIRMLDGFFDFSKNAARYPRGGK